MSDLYEKGAKMRRRVLGDAHVDRAEQNRDDIDSGFQNLVTVSAWATVWSSDAITLRERSMLTLGMLAALGNIDEFKLHLRATANTGASRQDVVEVLQHVAIYAGVPRANHAVKITREIYAEMEAEADAGKA